MHMYAKLLQWSFYASTDALIVWNYHIQILFGVCIELTISVFFLLLLEFWHLNLTMFRDQVVYLHFLNAWKRSCSTFANMSSFEQMVFALWYNVPTTQYLDGSVLWLSHCIYKSVWMVFLYTEVWRVPSSLCVIRMSMKGMAPLCLVSSLVNVILGWMWFKWSRNLSLSCSWIIVNVSSTNLF